MVDALGVFKSELKTDFIQFEERGSNLEMILQEGINLNKLDKGCLIFNYKKEEGYKILSVDSNRYDARYWLEHFLAVDAFQDENFMTKKYLKFCQEFAKEVVFPAEDKKEDTKNIRHIIHVHAKATDKGFHIGKHSDASHEHETVLPPNTKLKYSHTTPHYDDEGNRYEVHHFTIHSQE